MRTTLDLPDELMRHLKARAALEGRSLRDLVLSLVERGMQSPAARSVPAVAALPTLRLGHALPLAQETFNHADLSALADD